MRKAEMVIALEGGLGREDTVVREDALGAKSKVYNGGNVRGRCGWCACAEQCRHWERERSWRRKQVSYIPCQRGARAIYFRVNHFYGV